MSSYLLSLQMCLELVRWRALCVTVVACGEMWLRFDRRLLVRAEVAHRALSHSLTFDYRRAAALREAMQGHLPFVTSRAGARPWARRDYCDPSQRLSVGPAIDICSLPHCPWGL